MIEIVPAIIAKTYEEFESMIQKVEAYTNRIHIDIMDGGFVNNQTISGPTELMRLAPKLLNKDLKFEVHLMVQNPYEHLPMWLNTPVSRYLIHVETAQENFEEIEQIVHGAGKEIGPSLNPETSLETVDAFMDKVDLIQLLGVEPGFYGREFLRFTISRIAHIHELYPNIPIQVDGGINPETAKISTASGASMLVSGSYIFKSPNVANAINELRITTTSK